MPPKPLKPPKPSKPSNIVPDPEAVRQRKPHRKSRQGCGNCKLRSVKCDESKPACKRCSSSGFTCNYSRAAPDLQLVHSGAFKIDLCSAPGNLNLGARIPVVLPVPGCVGDYEMRPADFAALDRFRSRTVSHMGTSSTRQVFADKGLMLGFSQPFLIHVFLTLTLTHDTYVSPGSWPSSHRSLLAFHWYHATVLFKKKLSQPLKSFSSTERDALWVAAALLGAAAFAHLDSDDPKQVWPLAPPDPFDLDWLKMGDGKKVVWDLVDPLREGSGFTGLASDMQHNLTPDGRGPLPLDVLPKLFCHVLELSPSTDPDENPYYTPACVLAHILPHEIDDQNMLSFLTFTTQMSPEYKARLAQKDPRALLLLCWWYAKTCHARPWWLRRRSVVEGLSICLYIERECPGDLQLLELLKFPRTEIKSAGKSPEVAFEILPPPGPTHRQDDKIELPYRVNESITPYINAAV